MKFQVEIGSLPKDKGVHEVALTDQNDTVIGTAIITVDDTGSSVQLKLNEKHSEMFKKLGIDLDDLHVDVEE